MSSEVKNIVFLVSSNGGSLKFLNEYLKLNPFQSLNISYVIGDRQCAAIDYAKRNAIPNRICAYDKGNRENLYKILIELNPDLIITNIFKILDSKIVREFRYRLINFHYSLLPAFKGYIGMDTLVEARKLNCQFVGSTCHYVDEEVDNGKIISQCVFRLSESSNQELVTNTLFRANCIMALNSILILFDIGKSSLPSLNILGEQVTFSPALDVQIVEPTEEYWNLIKMN